MQAAGHGQALGYVAQSFGMWLTYALILFETLALYKSFTSLLTYVVSQRMVLCLFRLSVFESDRISFHRYRPAL